MHQRALEWLCSHLPRWTYASDDLKSCWLARRDDAVQQRYLGLNARACVGTITVDCDHDDPYRWRQMGLPTPLYVAVTPATGRHHVTWELERSVARSDNARRRPLAYLARIEAGLVDALKGDRGYVGLLTKNPAHSAWHTEWWDGRPVGLRDLAQQIELDLWEPRRRAVSEFASLGRNCALFEELRQWAYAAKANHSSLGAFRASAQLQAEMINRAFPFPLAAGEIRATVKSVATWTWRHYQGAGRPRSHWRIGLLNLDKDIPRRDRQALGAKHTHAVRTERTVALLQETRDQLLAAGQRATQENVARASGVSLPQVKRLWGRLTQAKPATEEGSAVEPPSGITSSDGAYDTNAIKLR